ncbi:PilZ domain-containing protein [Aestuariispira ectoiniformans]|uniref:PilZ domain-containing protein n=1 Tax=Aestuariispira ectoiniformans TaxID=2775080 RepID=UPI00223A6D75|nr:PilZ domain-containing protein [Aestuariispira ectoiniformans]
MSIFSFLRKEKNPADRRRSERVIGMGARAEIDKRSFPIADISMGGARVDRFFNDVAPKQRLFLTIMLMIDGKVESFPAQAVVRRKGNGGLALQFRKLQPYAEQKLSEFVRINSFKPVNFPI